MYEEHSNREINKVFLCENVIVKVSWELLVSNITNVVEEDDNEKGKRYWGSSWDTRQILDTGCWFTLGKLCFLKILNFLLIPTEQVSY